MKTLNQVYARLRRKNLKQYAMLVGCCLFSVLLITAYVSMMRAPTVLSVLPEGGDSRKQVMMIFALAVIGCGVFTTYASSLFFRYKSREVGVFMALGATRRQLGALLMREVALIGVGSCLVGGLLGAPLARALWALFRMLVVDTQEMTLVFDPQAYLIAGAFSLFVVLMLFWMAVRFVRRTNIVDVLSEEHRSEPVRSVPRWYGPVGIALAVAGCLTGYLVPSFFVLVLHWFAPEGLSAIFYIPAFVGLYMILLHTVVNGWRGGKNRYRHLISTSMMKFQGRQTVRNMLIVAVLIAGAYFAAFYTPMLGTGAMMGYETRPIDYLYFYRADQPLPDRGEVEAMAAEEGVRITRIAEGAAALLAYDGEQGIETETALGTTIRYEHRDMLASDPFLSESTYNALAGDSVDVAPGEVMGVFDATGDGGGRFGNDISLVTNPVTGETLSVTPTEERLKNDVLFGRRVLDDGDYARITAGLPEQWRERYVSFDVENCEETYTFAKRLFYEIVDRSGPEVEVYDAYDPLRRQQSEARGEPYDYTNESMRARGRETISYSERDSSNFRLFWKYMPQFRVLDKADFVKTLAVFLMLFIFIAVVCFAAVIVILYTRCMTIAMTNTAVFEDLRRLGASDAYLRRAARGQVSRVFFVPLATGTGLIFAFYLMIMYFNDNRLTAQELAGVAVCLLLVAACSALFYAVYRLTLRASCRTLGIGVQK